MSADEQNPAPATPDAPAPESTVSYPVSLVLVATGRQHGVGGGASFDLIRDDDGNPEVEYALVASIDGVNVPLQSWPKPVLDQLAASEKARTASATSG